MHDDALRVLLAGRRGPEDLHERAQLDEVNRPEPLELPTEDAKGAEVHALHAAQGSQSKAACAIARRASRATACEQTQKSTNM
eukprot:2141593-Alexandrium_andersonii.AAC.1